MTGRLAGIAGRPARRAAMIEADAGHIEPATGLAGDYKGAKYSRRQITVLSLEAWAAALAELADLAGPVPIPWTARRANLLVEAIRLPSGRGSILRVGPVRLEVTGETYPCVRMDEVHRGLLKALAHDSRGGVTCRVLDGGPIRIGDPVQVELAVEAKRPRLPP